MFTGHPKGLFRLFFIEMWERLGFYTMVGILFLYTIDADTGGLGLSKVVSGEIAGMYLAFVYFTPYLGGLIADRFLGYRKSVLIGGLFFTLGYALLGIYGNASFVAGLVCLCVGNGFFKPNVSVMVGNLYRADDPKRDAGFSIFYMGINIGAFVANFLAAIMRNEYGWLWVFRAAAIGMVIGVVILLASWKQLEAADRTPGVRPGDTPFGVIGRKILGPAGLGFVGGYLLGKFVLPGEVTALVRPAQIGFLLAMVPIIVFFVRLARDASADERPGLAALLPIYVAGGTFFMVLHLNSTAMTVWAKENTDRREPPLPAVVEKYFAERAMPSYYANAGPEEPRPNQQSLLPVESAEAVAMFGQKRMSKAVFDQVTAALPADVRPVQLGGGGAGAALSERERNWSGFAFDVFEEVVVQEGTGAHGERLLSISPKEGARRLDRVALVRTIGELQIATFMVSPDVFRTLYDGYAEKYARPPQELPPGEFLRVDNSELYQSLNALFVVALTPLVVWLFQWLALRGASVTTARKIFIGMVVTMLSVLFMVLAGVLSEDGSVKVSWWWLCGFYGVITFGELCLSPMALSLVTKLSPKRFVGLTMGGWFCATAFGNNLSGFLGGVQAHLSPTMFFLVIAAACLAVAGFIYALLPRLDAAIKKYGA